MKTSEIEVSVVIPAFNAERFLRTALESVLGQTLAIAECIVVDDGSTDQTASVAANYASSRVRVVTQANAGVAAARNSGARASTSPVLSFLDADDAWKPERTERMVEVLQQGYDAVISASEVTDEDLSPVAAQRVSGVPTSAQILLDAAVPASTSSNLLVRREAFEGAGGFDERLSTSADWALFLALVDRYRVGFVDDPLTLYRRHPGNMSRSVSLMDHDMTLVYEEVFAGSHRVSAPAGIKRHAFGRLHGMIAGSYLHAGQVGPSVSHAVRAVAWRPAEIVHVLRAPFRRLQSLLRG
jgi:glycosyltransferase involved in cell wall biosynthesis